MAQPQAPLWRVTAQVETNRTDSNGRFVSGVLVSYNTRDGIAGTVFVPDAQYTPEYVRQLINARVAQHTQVAGLTG